MENQQFRRTAFQNDRSPNFVDMVQLIYYEYALLHVDVF